MNNNPIIAYLYLIEDGEYLNVKDMAAEYIAKKLDYQQNYFKGFI